MAETETVEIAAICAVKGPPHRFTREDAAENARKAHAARMGRLEKLTTELEALRSENLILHEQIKEQTPLVERVRDVERQIETCNEEWAEPLPPKDRQALATTLDKLYNIWALLTGHERPGIRKSAKPRRASMDIPSPE